MLQQRHGLIVLICTQRREEAVCAQRITVRARNGKEKNIYSPCSSVGVGEVNCFLLLRF